MCILANVYKFFKSFSFVWFKVETNSSFSVKESFIVVYPGIAVNVFSSCCAKYIASHRFQTNNLFQTDGTVSMHDLLSAPIYVTYCHTIC